MYTDGVTEANNINGEMYETERLNILLNNNDKKTSQELIEAVYEDVTIFQGGAEQFDDITMLTVNYEKHNYS